MRISDWSSDVCASDLAVVYRTNILRDDGALVEVAGYKMCRGANQLHPPFVCLFVRAGPDECGEERMVNVDNPTGITVDKIGRKYPHELGQYEVVRAV